MQGIRVFGMPNLERALVSLITTRLNVKVVTEVSVEMPDEYVALEQVPASPLPSEISGVEESVVVEIEAIAAKRGRMWQLIKQAKEAAVSTGLKTPNGVWLDQVYVDETAGLSPTGNPEYRRATTAVRVVARNQLYNPEIA